MLSLTFLIVLCLPSAKFLTVCAAFAMNGFWLAPWYRNHRDAAELDMLIKIFTFILTFGVVIAITGELIAGEIYEAVLLPSDQDLSGVLRSATSATRFVTPERPNFPLVVRWTRLNLCRFLMLN